MILIAAAVEYYFLNPLGPRAFGDGLANDLRRGDVSPALDHRPNLFIERARRNHRAAGLIIDHLRPDVPARTMHAEARALPRAIDSLPHAHVNAFAVCLARQSSNRCRHSGSPFFLGRSLSASLASLLLQTFA